MAYQTIHTTVGLSLMASAEATGSQINLINMAVGDGNGNPITPDPSMSTLVRETYRAAVNRVYQDPNISNKFSAELIVPASVGGFTLREVGVFDSNGNLFVVGNLPDTYKPSTTDGAFSDTVIRVDFMVSNASVVQIIADPNVVVVTQKWISNNVTASTLIPGGTTGQVLKKHSNANGDVMWDDPTNVNVFVSAIEETQVLAAGQTVVNWAVVNNTGLAVYIEGVRLRNDGTLWTATSGNNTQITLAFSYPAGTKITGTQNEPASTLPVPLVQSQNLADLPNVTAARTNLNVYSKSESNAAGQPGAVTYFALTAAPQGWLKANGAAISRVAYANLFAAIGTTFGAGDGFTSFNLPDLRGEFLRGFDDGRGIDSGRAMGSWQADVFKSHNHGVNDPSHSHGYSRFYGDPPGINQAHSNGSWAYASGSYNMVANQENTAAASTGISIQNAGDIETRPRNIALLACIKF